MAKENIIESLNKELFAVLKKETDLLKSEVGFAIIQVGENPASSLYVEKKEEMAKKLNIKCQKVPVSERVSEDELIVKIKKLNNDKNISGIMVQLPLPSNINTRKVLDSINPEKDIDGLNSENLGKLFTGQEAFYPATPVAVSRLLDKLKVNIEGKGVVVIGGSDLVGKPLGMILLNKGATVTTCNSKTRNLKEIASHADVLIVAIGKAGFIKADMVKGGATVIDIGINRENGKILGDVNYDSVKNKAGFLTPVPGGIGPLTVLTLMENVLKSMKK